MTHRENLIKALRRQQPAYVPWHLVLTPPQQAVLLERTGSNDEVEYFDLPARPLSLPPTQHFIDYSAYTGHFPADAIVDEWGVGRQPGSVAHFTRMYHPMQDFDSPEQVAAFPLPDVTAEYRWEAFRKQVRETQAEGRAAGYFAVQVFEPAWYLRGMENLMMDMVADEEMAAACLNRMTDIKVQVIQKAAASGVDFIVTGDDVGTQRDMLMSPEQWRKWLKPVMKRLVDAARAENPEVLLYYHSDGVIWDIIPDLIEVGIEILNPVQPECMDPVKVKEAFGDRLAFWGTIGTQTTMPFGTPQQVKDTTRHMIETVGKGGGFCVAPTHVIEPEVPWENLLAFVEAAKEYGGYNAWVAGNK